MPDSQKLRKDILDLVRCFHEKENAPRDFVAGQTYIPASGKVFDDDELTHLVDASLDFWLTTGRYAERFEKEFRQMLGLRSASLCNSGSSANLLAVSALTSHRLGERRLKPGDEVISVAAGFPTTINPIVQNRLRPVFVDVKLPTYDVDIQSLERAITPQTKAIILAHTLGNPFDLKAVMDLVKRHSLWLIEDNCDALGSTYSGKPTGSFGHMATSSFYPAHHITMGEGGCVVTDDPLLEKIIRSLRDWGRDCWCDPGKDNTCGKRFDWQAGNLPDGYDHKYIYSHVGYNLKLTDMQAAIGVSQLKKLDRFAVLRRENWQKLYQGLESLDEFFILPESTRESNPSWFGFPLTLREHAPFSRNEFMRYLEEHKIGSRLIFAGDMTRQPAYQDIDYRVEGKLNNTQIILERSLWIGVFPGITSPMLEYMLEVIKTFIHSKINKV